MIHNPFITSIIQGTGMPAPTIEPVMRPTFAQAYEDVIIHAYMYANVERYNGKKIRFIEIGANHPVATSNSFFFEQIGIQSVLVEANNELCKLLTKFRPSSIVVNAAIVNSNEPFVKFYLSTLHEISSTDKRFVAEWDNGRQGIANEIDVPAMRIGALLDTYNTEIDDFILSIDVEGKDYDLLSDIDFTKHRPSVIIIEPSEEYQPGTVDRMCTYMRNQQYRLIARTYVNLIFERIDI
jgi:FkbM family methyltransferase